MLTESCTVLTWNVVRSLFTKTFWYKNRTRLTPAFLLLNKIFWGPLASGKKYAKAFLIASSDGASPSYYAQSVDDIFSVFNSHDQAKRFFSYLNSRHPNVKFTIEIEVNKAIPFLDVLIDIVTIFWIQLLIINWLILVYYLFLTILLLAFTK